MTDLFATAMAMEEVEIDYSVEVVRLARIMARLGMEYTIHHTPSNHGFMLVGKGWDAAANDYVCGGDGSLELWFQDEKYRLSEWDDGTVPDLTAEEAVIELLIRGALPLQR